LIWACAVIEEKKNGVCNETEKRKKKENWSGTGNFSSWAKGGKQVIAGKDDPSPGGHHVGA